MKNAALCFAACLVGALVGLASAHRAAPPVAPAFQAAAFDTATPVGRP